MNKPLRSLSGLIDFDSAVRCGSFKLAALELNKTPAAISQQIKQLEASLGFRLFTRHTRQLIVTEKGRELAGTVSKALRELNAKVASLQNPDDVPRLRVSTTHSFAMKWLVPRLHRFIRTHPELDIRIDSNDDIVDMDDASCDVAIRYGRVQDDSDTPPLFQEHLAVVYSPDLLAPAKKTSAFFPAALSAFPLLSEGSPDNWLRLFKKNKLTGIRADFSRNYSHSGLLVQAAVAAHGIALVPYSIACEDIARGSLLVAPFAPLPSQYGYRVLYRTNTENAQNAALFHGWLQQEADAMNNHLLPGR